MVPKKDVEMPTNENESKSIVPVGDDSQPIDPVAKVVNLPLPMPRHQARGSFKGSRAGAPKKIIARPTIDDLEYHAEMSLRRQEFIKNDELVQATAAGKNPVDVLQQVRVDLAREAAALLFLRGQEETYGRDTSMISSRRIAALRDIASLEEQIKSLGSSLLDVRSEQFQKVIGYFLTCIKEVAEDVLTTEQANLFFNRLETKLEDWEDQAQGLIR